MSTGITVQITSSRVWPCTWLPSSVRGRPRPRYFQMKSTSAPSTATKITDVNASTTQYAVLVRCACGEWATSGVKPPFAAAAIPAVARTVNATATTHQSFLRTRRAFYGGVLALADRPAGSRAERLRAVHRRGAASSWRRLRGHRTHARLPTSDRAGRAARLLALGGDVARNRRLVPQARDCRHRLRGRRAAARGDRAHAGAVGGLSGGA